MMMKYFSGLRVLSLPMSQKLSDMSVVYQVSYSKPDFLQQVEAAERKDLLPEYQLG
jgi:hypothetical protein